MRAIPVLFLVFLVAACATMNERSALAKSELVYEQIVETAITLRDQGHIGPETEKQLTRIFIQANIALSKAHEAIVEGRYSLEHIRQANELLAEASKLIE